MKVQGGMISEWRRGWPIVAGVAIGLGTGGTIFPLVGSLFTLGLVEEFGWSRGDVARMSAVSAVGVLVAPLIGWLADRYGFKPVVTVSTFGVAAFYLALASTTPSLSTAMALFIIYGVFVLGTGAIVYTRPINHAFHRSRGLALAFGTLGLSLTGIFLPPVLALIIEDYGWRAGLQTLAVLAALIGLPAALLLIRERSIPPGAAAEGDGPPLDAHLQTLPAHLPEVSLKAALRDYRFWCVALGLFAVNFPGGGALNQLSPLLQDKGLSASAAALAVSIYSIGILAGRLLCGFAIDRLPPARVAFAFTLLPALGALILFAGVPSLSLAALAVLLIGLQQGSEIDVIAFFLARLFGLKAYSAIYGVVAMLGLAGTTGGILFFGSMFDATGNYDVALALSVALFLAGAAAFAFIGRLPGAAPAR